jgi:phosphatidylglycerol:prolipoprotein diacylglycerol transferase
MEFWQNIYSHFNPIAFHLGSISVHWYGIMYATALLLAIQMGHWIIKKDNLNVSEKVLDSYILWAELGVVLGARIGYVLFYDTHTYYYLTHPWQIFNPFIDGMYAGISGMSYHGALIGFIISTIIWCKKNKISFWFMTDIAVLAIPLGYIFGRIGNFFNQELIGRVTDVPWGIYVNGILRHPSALYEAILEGLFVFIILFYIRKKKKFDGQLAIMYVFLYSIARITAEFFRQPDIQLGFIFNTSWLTMGMFISGIFIVCTIILSFVITTKIKDK